MATLSIKENPRSARTALPDLVIRNLRASIDGAEILKGIDLELSQGRDPRHHGAERLR